MTERLTDEQVAEAEDLELAQAVVENPNGWTDEHVTLARRLIQVSADLSEARSDNQKLRTRGEIGTLSDRMDASEKRAQAAEAKLSALQESAREAVEAMADAEPVVMVSINMQAVDGGPDEPADEQDYARVNVLVGLRAALFSLRSLLEGE